MVAKLRALFDPVTIGLEATGDYWLALYDELTERGYPVTVLNPFQVAAYRRSGLRKLKTDASDAGWIADVMRVANPPPTSQNIPIFLQLRELTRFRFRLVEQTSNCKRKILSILDRVFPEYETLFSSVFLKSSRALLEEAATAQEIADFDLADWPTCSPLPAAGASVSPRPRPSKNSPGSPLALASWLTPLASRCVASCSRSTCFSTK